ncbi:MAG TPA: TlyA family RNA methyltransferase [Tissierellia bacterium]|nr:TlyA family RNA methyltransferase [Tissierellia bacterium]
MAKRLDVRLVELGLVPSRRQAQALILAGQVRLNQKPATKAGQSVHDDDQIELTQREHYVSRGAYKLLKAIEDYRIDLSDKICLDVGASTGGFTQVMLEAGAKQVYAVDVGYGQFDYTLRQDARVRLLERQNARYLSRELLPEKIDFFSMDVSFISVRLILPAIKPLLADDGQGVILIKPQFEAGRDQVGKGIVTDPAIHRRVITGILEYVDHIELYPLALGYSPIKGPKGNREFLLYLSNRAKPHEPIIVDQVVADAHREL